MERPGSGDGALAGVDRFKAAYVKASNDETRVAAIVEFCRDNQLATSNSEDGLRLALSAAVADVAEDEEEWHLVNEAFRRVYAEPRGRTKPVDWADVAKTARHGFRYRTREIGCDREEWEPRAPAAEVFAGAIAALPEPERPSIGRRLGDLWDRPPPPWLIPDAVPGVGLTVIYGAPKAGKSFVAVDLAAAVQTGRPWLGAYQPSARGQVVYFALEAEWETATRAKAWAAYYGEEQGIRDLIFGDPTVLKLGDMAVLREAAETIKAAVGRPALVVIDTWAQLMGLWGLDETKPAEQNLAATYLERLAMELDAPILIVAHAGKDATRGIRGSNALEAKAGAVICAEGLEKGNMAVQLTVELLRSAAAGWQTTAVVQPTETGVPVFRATSDIDDDMPDHYSGRLGGPSEETVAPILAEALTDYLCSPDGRTVEVKISALAKTVAAHFAPMEERKANRVTERLLTKARLADHNRHVVRYPEAECPTTKEDWLALLRKRRE